MVDDVLLGEDCVEVMWSSPIIYSRVLVTWQAKNFLLTMTFWRIKKQTNMSSDFMYRKSDLFGSQLSVEGQWSQLKPQHQFLFFFKLDFLNTPNLRVEE